MTDEQYGQLVIPGKNDYSILVSCVNISEASMFQRLVFLAVMAPTDIVFGLVLQLTSTTVRLKLIIINFNLLL